jgi:serine acetyltransferase
LKRGCRIGAQTIIVPGVTIGEDVIIGTNSYVNRDIHAGQLWYGTLARFARKVTDVGKLRSSLYCDLPLPLLPFINVRKGYPRLSDDRRMKE